MTKDRTTRYCTRVEAHIAGWPPAAALTFLRNELEKWMRRYTQFQREVMDDRYIGDATAWDYAETIAVLGAKISVLERDKQEVKA